MPRVGGLLALSCGATALGLALIASPLSLAAARVGVAAAVIPDATSVPPGESSRTLRIGSTVVYNERIDTSGSGVVQVLLLDGSTFTVGPNSDLVIDKFVYDPARGKGELVASFSKGALRFIGGKLSKPVGGIEVKTPAGQLTVRGGIFQGIVSGPNQALFSFVFGNELSLKRDGQLYRLTETGNSIDVHGPGAPVLRPTLPAETLFTLASVSGRKWSKVKLVKGQPFPHYYGVHPIGWQDYPRLQTWIDLATQDQIRNALRPVPLPPTPPRVIGCGVACR
jgi:FecR protein